uniref:Nucleolar and spindle associated protein 1 n=1 Tax=Amphiprion percula TaxID=161767 RepID=A0A3P8SIW9_AMPPE
MDLDSMKYAELQKLAKELGLKANMKVENRNAAEEAASSSTVFVNTRRGKGNCIKRKLPDAAAVTKFVPTKSYDHFCKSYLLSLLDFKKLHEAQFNKMESIDSYFQRRTKQMETHKNQDLKKVSDKTKPQQVDDKAQAKNPTRATMFSPALVNKKTAEERRRHTLLSASKPPPNKPARKDSVPFRPSVLSTRRINVRFSEATQDNEHKRSLVKTPARMSPCLASSTPQRQAANAGKPSGVNTPAFSATKIPGPFVFSGNTSSLTTPGTQKKPTFDLKASLSRPLSYRPHTGKLKPFGEVKENTAGNQSVNSNTRQDNYKQHKVQSRDDRRTKQKEDRKQKKRKYACARRGLLKCA